MTTKRRIASAKRAASLDNCQLSSSESIYCRTCLNTDNLVSIFISPEAEYKMSENLKLVTGLQIKLNDGLSQKICTQCLKIFNLTLQFRRKSKRAEKTLLGLTSRVKQKKYSVLKPDVKPRLKKAKEEEYDYGNTEYGNDFQNDDDFDCKEDVKPIYVIKEQNTSPALNSRPRKKPMKIPNATSYKCNACNKEYRMKATYKAHMRFHTNYCVCESCGKRCRNNIQLQEHKRARHGLGRIHKCAYCEYSSATKEALVIHERRHTGERPYICDHCGANFHRRSNLVQHIAIHLPDKNFQCTFCPTREKSKKRLQIHISKRHSVQRYSYKCPRCFKLFHRIEHVRRHLARVHHVPRPEHPPIERVLVDKAKAAPTEPWACDTLG